MSERRFLFSEEYDVPSPLGRTGGAHIVIQVSLGSHPRGGPMFMVEAVAFPYDKHHKEVEHKRITLYWGEPTLDKLRHWLLNQAAVFTRPLGLVEREREVIAFLTRVAGQLVELKMRLDSEQARKDTAVLHELQRQVPTPSGAYQDPSGDWVFPEAR